MRISAILSLLSAGENRNLFIMPEFYKGVNALTFLYCCYGFVATLLLFNLLL